MAEDRENGGEEIAFKESRKINSSTEPWRSMPTAQNC